MEAKCYFKYSFLKISLLNKPINSGDRIKKFIKKLFKKYVYRLERMKDHVNLIDYRQSDLHFYVEFEGI